MKTLSQHLLEHMSIQVNEAFNSQILSGLRKTSSDNRWKQVFDEPVRNGWLPMQWSNISDDDLYHATISDAKKAAKTGSYVLWVDRKGELLGITKGDVVYTGYSYSGRRYQRKEWYKTVSGISKESTEAIVITGADKYSSKDLRDGRWRSKLDATAFNDNWLIASANRSRYTDIVKSNGNLSAYPEVKKTLDKAEKRLSDATQSLIKVLEKSAVLQDWSTMASANTCVAEALKSFGKMKDRAKEIERGTSYEFYLKEFKNDYGNLEKQLGWFDEKFKIVEDIADIED